MTEESEDNSVEWEAAHWVSLRMGAEPFDAAGFEAWLAGDPRRKELFDAMWSRIMGSHMDSALGAITQHRRSRRSLVAGCVVAAVTLIGGYQAMPAIERLMSPPQIYSADAAMRQVLLEDGTQLTLAGGGEVRVRYSSHIREVELTRGTLFADVSHDESRPFQIEANGARISDLGTRFEVTSKSSFVRVTVESGAVRFAGDGWFAPQVELGARQAAVLTKAGLSRTDDVSQDGVARWRTEWVEYQDTPLQQVVADLESVSPLPIRILDGKLADLRVSGRIRLTDPVRQLDNLSFIHKFAVTQRDGAILLSSGK